MKIVLDSNVLLVSIGKQSKFRPIWDSFVNGKFQLILSQDILHEYEEILLEHAAVGAAEIILEVFVESPDIIFQRVFYFWHAINADADDNKFFDVAFAANADYLVTDDNHFSAAKLLAFPTVNIINSETFLKIIKDV